jgi:maleate isomerase
MPSIPDLATCKKLGFIVPSSNTAVEPITQAVVQSLNENIICIFTRIQVKTVGVDKNSTSQFSAEAFVDAARLLADSEPDVILWNGTSGQWTGGDLEDEKQLAKAMQDATGIPCSTNTLATVEALELLKAKNISIAVPYAEAHTAKVAEFFEKCGYNVVKSERLATTPATNKDIAKSSSDEIKEVIRRSGVPPCEAVIASCTNWPATGLVEELERELNITVIDSISVTAWWALRMAGCTTKVKGWGRLLEM